MGERLGGDARSVRGGRVQLQGRMRGIAVLDDFVEYKHIQLKPAPEVTR